jgi:GR25 family glycosyltransferase involved in LPS biosynthesis
MSYQGIYINLDRCPERRAALDAELARYGLTQRYRRLPAIDGNPDKIQSRLKNGEVGCFLSHVRALQEGLKTNQHLHVVEDDTIFAACTAPTIEWAISSGAVGDYDILYTDIAFPFTNDSFRMFKNLFDRAVTRNAAGGIQTIEFQALNLKPVEFLSTSSYLVNKNSFQKLRQLYEAEVAEGIRVPIDLFFRNHARVGSLKVGCLFPFITSGRVEEVFTSTVRTKPDTTRKFTAATIARYSFFVGCDWDQCQKWMDEYIAQPPANDRHAQLLARLLAFSLLIDEKTPTP